MHRAKKRLKAKSKAHATKATRMSMICSKTLRVRMKNLIRRKRVMVLLSTTIKKT
jgi:hypothetical protein